MYRRNFSPTFYRTSSPIGSAAQKNESFWNWSLLQDLNKLICTIQRAVRSWDRKWGHDISGPVTMRSPYFVSHPFRFGNRSFSDYNLPHRGDFLFLTCSGRYGVLKGWIWRFSGVEKIALYFRRLFCLISQATDGNWKIALMRVSVLW